MRNFLTIFFLFGIICCKNKTAKEENFQKSFLGNECEQQLSIAIEVWNYTGNENLIGDFFEKFENKYQESNGWDKDNHPYPKKFDVKIVVQNNLLAYEQESPSKINNYTLDVILKLKVGQSPDAMYPLNSKIVENIELINDRIITDADFVNQPIEHNYYIDIWIKEIPFEELYKKYQKQNLFINQLIFEIKLTDKKQNICNYEYVFPMLERGD